VSVATVVADAVEGIIETVAGDTAAICRDAQSSNLSDWRGAQIAKAAAVGGGSAIIPVAGYLTLPADLAATLRIMHRAATGIAYLRLGQADEDTFAGILAVWSGAVKLDNALLTQMGAKGLAATAVTVGGPIGLKMAIKAFTMSAGVIAAKKLGPQVAQKVASKIATKLAGKATTRWIPVVSAIAGAGINWWMVEGICDATDEYCQFIKRAASEAPRPGLESPKTE
jgi:hypothetical protein